MFLIQNLVLVVMSGAYVFAIVQSSTIGFVMLMAYGFVSQFFPLVMASLYLPGRVSGGSAITALATGVAVTAFFTIGPIPRPGGLDGELRPFVEEAERVVDLVLGHEHPLEVAAGFDREVPGKGRAQPVGDRLRHHRHGLAGGKPRMERLA